MRDFPFFTTEHGAASLVLREIPYREEAYVTLRATQTPEALLAECVDFCRACGAKKVYASGHRVVEGYPFHTAMVEMRGIPNVDEDLIESLFPVTEATVARWREIYNRAFSGVHNAATQEARDEKRILEGNAYFVHHQGELLGIGLLREDTLEAMASVKPGMGKRVLHSLCSVRPGVPLRLEVASENYRAISLYESVGFCKVKELSRWYCIEK